MRDNPETGLKKGDLIRKVGDLKCRRFDVVRRVDLRRRLRRRREPLEAPRLGHRSGRPRPLSRASGGPGRTTCASSTTAPRATRTASPIRARNRSCGGTRRRSAGRATTCRTFPSRPTAPTRRTASGPSTWTPRASAGSSPPSTRTPTRDTPIIGATWPTCRRTARCRRCTSRSRARSRTCCTRA